MTTSELAKQFNERFGFGKWPETLEVDHETYANICQSIFKIKLYGVSEAVIYDPDDIVTISNSSNRDGRQYLNVGITLGPNRGIMFKNVELILKPSE